MREFIELTVEYPKTFFGFAVFIVIIVNIICDAISSNKK